jgi:hypothetical protein
MDGNDPHVGNIFFTSYEMCTVLSKIFVVLNYRHILSIICKLK